MDTIFIYLLKVNIAIVLFYVLYVLFLRNDTFIRLRRYYFLTAIVFSLSYPLFSVTSLANIIDLEQEAEETQTTVLMGELYMGEMIVADVEETTQAPTDWALVAKNILLGGTLILGLRFLWQLFSILRIKSRSEKKSLFGYLIYHLRDEITPFSFFKWIFIHTDTHNEEELKQILLHEQTHSNQWHSIDIVLVEMLRILFWYNPIVWLMKRDVAINLEYLADNAVIEKGIDTREYQYHLLQLTYHETPAQIVNNFKVPQLKQRIMMMNSKKSPMRKLAKYLSVFPLALLLITANSVYAQANEIQESKKEIVPPPPPPPQKPQKKGDSTDEVFVVVEDQPSYKEGAKAMMNFVESEMKYPVISKENGIQGRVIVNFIVEKDGSITNTQIVRGVDPALDKEAIRIIEAMPKWKPGKQRGQNVRVRYTLPISFSLNGNKDSSDMTTVGIKFLQDKEGEEQEEVIVRGYDSMNKLSRKNLLEKLGNGDPLYIVNDVKMVKGFKLNSIIPTKIESISVLKDKSAMDIYGEEGKDGVILITLKDTKVSDKENSNNEIEIMGYDSTKQSSTQTLANKFGDKKPLYIIDGIIMDDDFDLNSINPDDISSVNVLKNESAMPIYGDKGKNGVIIISTKGGALYKEAPDENMTQEKKNGLEEIFVVVEDQPQFPGGVQALMKFLGDNIRYPEEAHKNGTEGRVITNFVVEKDGSIEEVNIVRSVSPLIDAEAIRVIKMMPKWKPGKQRGQNVRVRYTLPMVFKLNPEKKDDNEAMKKLKEGGPVSVYDEKQDDPDKGFLNFIAKNIKYPTIAQENGIMGLSKATYDVNANGEISNVKTTEGTDPALDKELRRVIKLMPKDIALMKSGGKAASNVEISALFRLQNGKTLSVNQDDPDVVVVGYGKPAE